VGKLANAVLAQAGAARQAIAAMPAAGGGMPAECEASVVARAGALLEVLAYDSALDEEQVPA
jgi:hypothetical protein